MALYKQHFIWERINSKEACRYACLEHLESNLFFVQSSDYFHLPIVESAITSNNNQFIELFIEEDISTRTQGYETASEAIAAHKSEFESF